MKRIRLLWSSPVLSDVAKACEISLRTVVCFAMVAFLCDVLFWNEANSISGQSDMIEAQLTQAE